MILLPLDPTHLADVIANVTKNVFVQEQVIRDAFYHDKNNDGLHEGIEEIRDLKSVTGIGILSNVSSGCLTSFHFIYQICFQGSISHSV